jgi:hypothetical protein
MKGGRGGRARERGQGTYDEGAATPPIYSHLISFLTPSYTHTHEQVKKTTKMMKVFKSYAERKGVSVIALRFFYDGTVREWEGGREGGRA